MLDVGRLLADAATPQSASSSGHLTTWAGVAHVGQSAGKAERGEILVCTERLDSVAEVAETAALQPLKLREGQQRCDGLAPARQGDGLARFGAVDERRQLVAGFGDGCVRVMGTSIEPSGAILATKIAISERWRRGYFREPRRWPVARQNHRDSLADVMPELRTAQRGPTSGRVADVRVLATHDCDATSPAWFAAPQRGFTSAETPAGPSRATWTSSSTSWTGHKAFAKQRPERRVGRRCTADGNLPVYPMRIPSAFHRHPACPGGTSAQFGHLRPGRRGRQPARCRRRASKIGATGGSPDGSALRSRQTGPATAASR